MRVVLLGAIGGLAVSFVFRFADNILKSFAVGVSIALNCALSWMIFGVHLTRTSAVGIALVMAAATTYSLPQLVHAPPGSPGTMAEEEQQQLVCGEEEEDSQQLQQRTLQAPRTATSSVGELTAAPPDPVAPCAATTRAAIGTLAAHDG